MSRTGLERMAESMAWYGPDGISIWSDGGVGLGHLMLHTTSESLTERQPWRDPLNGLAITADARLDNRDDLRRILGISTHVIEGMPDSHLILGAYQKWGESCVDHLLGDFAFSIWDVRERRLFCARDHLGLRPFYYFHSEKQMVFASSTQAVLRAGGVPIRIDRGRVADYLVQGLEGINKTCSFFENIHRLPPAHAAVLEKQKLSVHRYWNPDADRELRLGSDDEYRDAFSEVFYRAVGDRLRCQAPVASMLSGGLDSSTIVGVAREIARASGSGFDTYSAISNDADRCIESGFIRRAIEHGGLDPHCFSPSVITGADASLSRAMEMPEDPWDSMNAMLFVLYRAASNNGHVVLLDGVDGDLVASLPETYTVSLARRGRLVMSWHEFRQQRKNYYRSAPSAWRYLRVLRSAFTPTLLKQVKKRLTGKSRLENTLEHSLISRRFGDEVSLEERLLEYDRETHTQGQVSLRQACIDRVTAPYLAAANERGWRTAIYCGVEHRKPFLDKRVVEFCVSLPWDQKFRHGWSKLIVRRLAETILPSEIAWRKGWEHLGWSFTEAWLKRERKAILEVLDRNRENLEQFVDPGKYSRVIDDFRVAEDKVDENVRVLHGLACWLERHGW